jgi:hypothetical protein
MLYQEKNSQSSTQLLKKLLSKFKRLENKMSIELLKLLEKPLIRENGAKCQHMIEEESFSSLLIS